MELPEVKDPSPWNRQVQALGPLSWSLHPAYETSSMPPSSRREGQGALFIEFLFHRSKSGPTIQYAGPASLAVAAGGEGLRRFPQNSFHIAAAHGLRSAFGIADEQRGSRCHIGRRETRPAGFCITMQASADDSLTGAGECDVLSAR